MSASQAADMGSNPGWRDALLVLDNTTTVDPANSSCGHSEQTLALRCGTNLLSMTFTKNETNFLSGIVAEYVLDTVHFPDAQHQGEGRSGRGRCPDVAGRRAPRCSGELVKVGNESLHLFGVEQGRSYLCGVDSPVPLGGNTTLDVLNVQLQAFVNATVQPEGFGSANAQSMVIRAVTAVASVAVNRLGRGGWVDKTLDRGS
ncbi:hypothetical protein HPB47_007544 [Ixodes persulcatus]|uniref:Uncharacterized protein n=1 Tax=Ixodes persulcatus TaxID=34615 RepID=A0AC60P7X2_IXOPE|nr:hypothetical protein HPB47_007544 [Ixodes persulcatus]